MAQLEHSGGRKIIIIAGPNGAGKTTFAQEYLPGEPGHLVFLNADLIASDISPSRPEAVALRAGRLMLQEISNHAERGENFAFETTLAGRGYVERIRRWRAEGYRVKLFFLSLATPEEAIRRVRGRVAQGGHNIPEEVIRRRFSRGLRNFETIYRPCVNYWRLFNNSGNVPVVIEEGENP